MQMVTNWKFHPRGIKQLKKTFFPSPMISTALLRLTCRNTMAPTTPNSISRSFTVLKNCSSLAISFNADNSIFNFPFCLQILECPQWPKQSTAPWSWLRMFAGQRVLIIFKSGYDFQYDGRLAVGGHQFCFESKCGLAIERRSWYVPPNAFCLKLLQICLNPQ
jgi:hypothetical protein